VRRVLVSLAISAAFVAVAPVENAAAAVFCHGHVATIVGSDRGDTLVGTKQRDIIAARGGNDAVVGRGGNDLICGGPGSDLIDGGAGLDPVYAGSGYDACAAPTADEHQLHHGCEAHLTPPPPGVPPPPSTSSIRSPARADVAPRGGSPEYHDAGSPTCGQNVIDLGNVNASGAYTDPSYVAFRPGFWEWGANGWIFRGYNDWQVYHFAYNGGQVYRLPAGSVPADSGYWYVGYQFYWWNGSAWVDYAFSWATVYQWEGFIGLTTGYCAT
jgi:RTX calcium-binding nonapeptide repeat (4 copies)